MSILHLLTQHNMLAAVFSYLFLRSVIISIVFMTNETDLCIVNVFIIFVLFSIIVYQNGNGICCCYIFDKWPEIFWGIPASCKKDWNIVKCISIQWGIEMTWKQQEDASEKPPQFKIKSVSSMFCVSAFVFIYLISTNTCEVERC